LLPELVVSQSVSLTQRAKGKEQRARSREVRGQKAESRNDEARMVRAGMALNDEEMTQARNDASTK
jgi:hypothetical protein